MSGNEQTAQKRTLCLVWAPFSARMDELSSEIGGKKVFLTFLYGHMYLAPFRYAILFLRTMLLIAKERPDIIYAQNPSVFCPLSCLPYCKLWRKKLIIDHHAVWSMKTFSTGLLGRTIRKLEKFVVSRSNANTTANPLWARELEEMGARHVLTVYDYVSKSTAERDEKIRDRYSEGKKFIALAPHGGHPLERIESEVEAAHSIDSVSLLLSGPTSKMKGRLIGINLGSNVRYIGFLDKDEFEKLKASVDLGLSITDEPYTISHSLLEFAACSVPAISSAQKAVRLLFGESLMYVRSSKPSDIREAMEVMFKDSRIMTDYRDRIIRKQEELILTRRHSIQLLKNLILEASS
jgi:glycosyltransferase involved in cell wall biosynthesis